MCDHVAALHYTGKENHKIKNQWIVLDLGRKGGYKEEENDSDDNPGDEWIPSARTFSCVQQKFVSSSDFSGQNLRLNVLPY